MPSVSAAESFKDHTLAAIFIDAAHDQVSVLQDIAAWLPKLAPGGIIAGHDYDHPEVKRAVTSAFPAGTIHPISTRCWIYRPE
jgi:thiamine phosphate synthase YjbQ (UPF0047 family)